MKIAILTICFSTALAAQTVEGGVYDRLTGAPLAGVSVSQTAGVNSVTVRTDASGHFRFLAQAFGLHAARAGYLPRTVSSHTGAATVRIELTPESIVAGKLEDEDGFPVERAQVQVTRYQSVNGERKLLIVGWAQSDDRGEYRIGNLPAGRYYVRVNGGDARNWDARYVSQYFGGGLEPSNDHVVELAAGEERKGVDVRLTKYEGVTLTGRVEGTSGGQFARQVTLSGSGDPWSYYSAVVRSSDGNWTIRHVPPGNYTLRYQSGTYPPKAGDLLAETAVKVEDRDLPGLLLTPHQAQAVDVEGRIVAAGGEPGRWQIALRGATGQGQTAHSNEDGTFVLKGLLPGHYDMQILPENRGQAGIMNPSSFPLSAKLGSPLSAMLGSPLSAKLGEKEVLRSGFDVDSTPPGVLRIALGKPIGIAGTVVDPQGQPIAGATLFFRSDQPGGQGVAVAGDSGVFHSTLNAAGDYHVYMAADVSDLANQGGEDEYLKAHAQDFPVLHVVEGRNPPVTLVWRGK
jgi:hypothetical protein